jgi:hypothetical protein
MTDKRILFGDFEFPRTNGLKYLLNVEQLVTDYLFVNEPHDEFSMYFENGFPIFTVPENSERPYFLFEIKHHDRMIKFFCPEKHPHLNSAVWYFYVEVFDEQGVAHVLPGQVRVAFKKDHTQRIRGKPRFIEVLEGVKLATAASI